MEYFDLSRYYEIKRKRVPLFSELKLMQPLLMTQDLRVVDTDDNIAYAKYMASKGSTVVPIKRIPPTGKYIDRESFPRRILFEMTNRCNYLCRMCPQQDMTRPRVDMSGELYRRIIDEIDSNGIEGLWLYHLGESLLHPEFRENIRHISKKNNLGVIWMSTNGQYFTEDNIRTVLDSNIDYINFSMHAVTASTYKTVASEGDFTAVRNNLSTFYKMKGTDNMPRKPFLHCQMIEQETTKHEVDAFINEHHRYADIVSINMLEYANLPNNTFGHNQRERKQLTSCLRVSRNDCFIFSNGHVTLCDAAYNGEIFLGDVNNEKLSTIWNSSKRRNIIDLNKEKRMFEIEFCKTCTDYDI